MRKCLHLRVQAKLCTASSVKPPNLDALLVDFPDLKATAALKGNEAADTLAKAVVDLIRSFHRYSTQLYPGPSDGPNARLSSSGKLYGRTTSATT
ncbi:hypothetical protein M378DRAFT_906431 [Amanita muscaria Koide BX008]|uniref:Uncharacterized protein n=1 Tax=Amanita muscaria (strain Koide BX008) TaxID=946122 RepID=A0A0C2SCR8_AMAMK|nr:hypothetical protein M378DRAFT_906431 [Amanita muscaria Koide BX008]